MPNACSTKFVTRVCQSTSFVDTLEPRQMMSTGSITGVLYVGTSLGARQDTSANRLSNFTVYIDKNSNGRFDSGERNVQTDSTGRYRITNVSQGSYRVRVNAISGYRVATPASGATLVTTTSPTQAVTSINFGLLGTASIVGKVYNDSNKNGSDDTPATSGISGRTLFLDLDGDKALDSNEKSVITNARGEYSFKDLRPGSYVAVLQPRAGWTISTPILGNYTFRITPGQKATGANFGTYSAPAPTGSSRVSGQVFNDDNGNARKDGNESWARSWLMQLVPIFGGGAPIETRLGVENAIYEFEDVPAGRYRLQIRTSSTPNVTTFPANGSYEINITSGMVSTGNLFGIR